MASLGCARTGIDRHVGHASPTPNPFHSTPYVVGYPKVLINGAPAVRCGVDSTACGDPTLASGGNHKVLVNGAPIHRFTDPTGGHGTWVANRCGSGSANVLA